MKKQFINGFDSWLETYTEMILYASAQSLKKPENFDSLNNCGESQVWDVHGAQGFVALIELAKDWTNQFELLNKGRFWDGEFWDETEVFARSKDLRLDFKTELELFYQKLLEKAEQAAKEPVHVMCAFDEGEDLYVPADKLNVMRIQKLIHVKDTGYRYFLEDLEKIKNILNS